MRRLIVAGVLTVLGLPAAAQPRPDPFPPGPGREIVAVACMQCHSAAPTQALRMNEAGWRQQIEIMIVHGAQVGPDEIGPASEYLASAFGPGVPFPGPAAKPVHLAAGPGQDLVEQRCGLCHGLDRVVATRRPDWQWAAIVGRMGEIGAALDTDQQRDIIGYLVANYGGSGR